MLTTSSNPNPAAAADGAAGLNLVGPRIREVTTGERALVDHSVLVLQGISRTFKGISDTSSSELKEKLLLEGDALKEKVAENFRSAILGLAERIPLQLNCVEDVRNLVLQIWRSLNDGLVPEGRSPWRSWETGVPAHPHPDEIQAGLDKFAEDLIARYNTPDRDSLAFAAWIEQSFNGKLHPMSDGCGRCSRALATLVLLESGLPLPSYKNREEFFEKINLPFEEWLTYYSSL